MIVRLRAANAADVVLNGDWPEGRGVKLAKDDQGAWSATVGPLTPELWYYTFNVDGASVVDPSNANLLRDGTCYMNFFIVPGPLSENYAIRDVPHGNVPTSRRAPASGTKLNVDCSHSSARTGVESR